MDQPPHQPPPQARSSTPPPPEEPAPHVTAMHQEDEPNSFWARSPRLKTCIVWQNRCIETRRANVGWEPKHVGYLPFAEGDYLTIVERPNSKNKKPLKQKLCWGTASCHLRKLLHISNPPCLVGCSRIPESFLCRLCPLGKLFVVQMPFRFAFVLHVVEPKFLQLVR